MKTFPLLVVAAACSPAPAAHPHPHHGPLVHRFEKADEWVAVFDDPARDAWQKPMHVVALMNVTDGMTVADLGTGTGYFLPYLAKAVGSGKVLALDVEPDMIRYVKERAAKAGLTNVEARVVPLDDPALPAGAVDRVLIVDTWHHIADRKAYAGKLAKGLRPGGAVFVVDFTMEAAHGPPKHHRLPKETVVEELAAAGLTAKIVASELPDQYVVAATR